MSAEDRAVTILAAVLVGLATLAVIAQIVLALVGVL